MVAGIAPTAAGLEDLRRGIETALGRYSLGRERGMEEDGQGYKKGKEWNGIGVLIVVIKTRDRRRIFPRSEERRVGKECRL